MGMVMSGATFAFMLGPTIGGWLYEMGGIRTPFLAVALLAVLCTIGFAWLQLPAEKAVAESVSITAVLRIPAVAACTAAVVAASATLSMLEPVLPLFLSSTSASVPPVSG
jgi:predicted MFS family arabinose efflux permease